MPTSGNGDGWNGYAATNNRRLRTDNPTREKENKNEEFCLRILFATSRTGLKCSDVWGWDARISRKGGSFDRAVSLNEGA